MRNVARGLLVCLAPLTVASVETVEVLRSPNWKDRLQVVLEFKGADGAALWKVDDAELDEVLTAAGATLEPSVFGAKLVVPGDPDPRKKGFHKLAEGSRLITFELDGAPEKVRAIPRFAGQYRLLHGGSEAWVSVPMDEPMDLAPWKDETLAKAGFDLQHGVRSVPLAMLRVSGVTFDLDEIVLIVEGHDEEVEGSFTEGGVNQSEYAYDLPMDETGAVLEKLRVRVVLDDGSSFEIDEFVLGKKYKELKDKRLKKADLKVEIRRADVLEVYCEGEGIYSNLRGFRWLDRRGKELELQPQARWGGGGKSVEASCRASASLPKGAQLELAVLIGAEWETVSFEYEDLAGPER